MSLNLKSLIGKLNDTLRDTLNNSAGLCMSRTHYDIEIEHFLLKTLESSDNDIAAILKHYGVDKSRLTADLQRALDNLKTGNARPPSFSPTLVKMLSEAWSIGSIEYDAGSVRTGFTLLALLTNEDLARLVNETTREFKRVEPEGLRKDFYTIVANSREVQAALKPTGGKGDATTSAPAGTAGKGKTPNLDAYTVQHDGECQGGQDRPGAGT